MENSYFKKTLLLFLLFSLSIQVTAQNWTNYYPSDGLIEGGIYSIIQAQNDAYWFGSWTQPEGTSGLGRFDGTTWEQFTTADGLVGDYTRVIFQDSSGVFWFGTTTGVTRFDGASVTNYTTVEGLVDDYVFSIIEDTDGNIWFGTAGGVSKFDGTTWTNYTTTDNEALISVSSLIQDTNDDFWFASIQGGVVKFDGTTWTNYNVDNSGLAANDAWAIYQDSNENIWVATYFGQTGVSKFDGTTWTTYTTADGLSNNKVRVITQDSFGDLWFGTNAGLSKYDGATWTTYTTADGLIPGGVRAITQDNYDDLWIGTWSAGVSKFEISKVNIPDPNFEQSLIDIGVDSDGIINQQILRTDALAVTDLNLTNPLFQNNGFENPLITTVTGKIADLTGIEAFVNLTSLGLGNGDLTSVDLSKNTLLDDLFLNDNQLTAIDISKNTKLTRFGVMRNPNIGLVDVSKNTLLKELFLENTGISTIDLSANIDLWRLHAQNNILTGVDVSLNINLTDFRVRYNDELTFVNIRNGNNDDIVGFDIRDTANLTCITADGTAEPEVSALMLGYSNGLLSEDCGTVYIPDANFEQALIVTGIDQLGVQDHIILRSDAIGAINLSITDAGVTDLTGIEAFINLESIEGDGNNLSSVDISNNTLLKQLHFNGNSLTSIDFSNNLLLEGVGLNSNNLAEIDLSLQSSLTLVAFGDNPELISMNLRNGNNVNLAQFIQWDLPSLGCITSDDIISQEMIDSGLPISPDCTNLVLIPDLNFEQALIDLGIDRNGFSGDILRSDAEAITELNVSNKGIADLTGIEAFVYITSLFCQNNQISTIDVSSISELTLLGIWNNQLSTLDLSSNISFKDLYADNNSITTINFSDSNLVERINLRNNTISSLDITNYSNLIQVDLAFSNITNIDISQNLVLEALYVNGNEFTTLDASKNINLKGLGVSDNNFMSLDLSNNPQLIDLQLDNNTELSSLDLRTGENDILTTFNVSNTPNLTCINADAIISPAMTASGKTFSEDCGDFVYIPDPNFEQALIDLGIDGDGVINTSILREEAELLTGRLGVCCREISDLTGVEAFINITELQAGENLLTEIDVSQNTELTKIWVYFNQLSNVDLSNNTKMQRISVGGNQLTSLDVLNLPDVHTILAWQNQLTTIDVSNNPLLTLMHLQSNLLTSINLANTPILDELRVSTNLLTSIDLSQSQNLNFLSVDNNQLSQLDISLNQQLTWLNAQYNFGLKLITVPITGSPALIGLDLSGTGLSNFSPTLYPNIEVLWLNENSISRLNTINIPNLRGLVMNDNQLSDLDLSSNVILEELQLKNNFLTELDMRNGNNAGIGRFWVENNLLTCISVDNPADLAIPYDTWEMDAGIILSANCGAEPEVILIPDGNFEDKLIADLIDTNGKNGNILLTEAEAVISLDVSGQGIEYLTGIEGFVNLTDLNVSDNILDDIDLIENTDLINLDVSGNNLSELFVNSGRDLVTLNCSNNQMNTLNLSDLTDLETFDGSLNLFQNIDATNNDLLTSFNVNSNLLTGLDIRNGNNTDITLFDATNNPTLFCIGVDDQSNIPIGWNKDVWSDYSNNPDCISPTIVAQAITIDLDNNGDASVIARDFDNGSTDNVSANADLLFTVDIEDFTCNDLGLNSIELTVTDEAGNSSSESVEVIVQDLIPPSVRTEQSFSHDLNGDAMFILDPLDVHRSSSDNCGIPSLSVNPSTFTSPGTYSVTLTATDGSGNSAEDYIDIEIEDSLNSTELRFGNTTAIVYPLPVGDVLNISFSRSINLNSVFVQLVSMGGVTYDIPMSPNSGSGDFVSGNTSSIPTGTYVLQVTVGNRTDSATIVKD